MTAGHNLAPVHNPPDVDGVAKVIGGVGGIRFQWEELEAGARIVTDAAKDLEGVWRDIKQVELGLSVARMGNDLMSPGMPVALGASAAEEIQTVLQKLAEGSSNLEETAGRIRRSRLAYELAEIATRDHLSHAAAQLLPSAPYASTPLTLQRTGSDSVVLQGSVEGLLSQVPHAAAEPGSAFEVLEVQGKSEPTYVVVIPGTEMRSPELPFGPGGVVEAKLADSEYVGAAVASALEEVGAEEGAHVVLVGYSQGGMHAVNLANSGRVGDHYSVEFVLTAGSPIAEEDVPTGTTFLHLAHEKDHIPALNLVPVADRPNQVSVVLDHQLKHGEGAHKIDSYRQGAQAVDLSSHPSIAPVTAALGTVVAGGVAKRHVFQLTRSPFTGAQPASPKEPVSEPRMREGSAPRAGDRPGHK